MKSSVAHGIFLSGKQLSVSWGVSSLYCLLGLHRQLPGGSEGGCGAQQALGCAAQTPHFRTAADRCDWPTAPACVLLLPTTLVRRSRPFPRRSRNPMTGRCQRRQVQPLSCFQTSARGHPAPELPTSSAEAFAGAGDSSAFPLPGPGCPFSTGVDAEALARTPPACNSPAPVCSPETPDTQQCCSLTMKDCYFISHVDYLRDQCTLAFQELTGMAFRRLYLYGNIPL